MKPVQISPNDRLFVSGRTGSGKTTFIRFLLRSVPRYAVLDPKHTYKPPLDEADDVPIVEEFDPDLPRQVIRVPWEDEPEGWDDVLNEIYEEGNRLVYVDEATLLVPTRAARHPLGKLIRTGRERGIGVWTGTQRPKEIPSYVFTESEHILSFRLQFKDDRDKVSQFSGDAMSPLLASVRGHDLAYYDVMGDRALRIRPRLVKGGSDESAGSPGSPGLLADRVLGSRDRKNGGAQHPATRFAWPWNLRGGGLNGRTTSRQQSDLARAG